MLKLFKEIRDNDNKTATKFRKENIENKKGYN